jgi:hypothetical protein
VGVHPEKTNVKHVQFLREKKWDCHQKRGNNILEELKQAYEYGEIERQIRAIVENVLKNSQIIVSEVSWGGRSSTPIKSEEKTLKEISIAIRSAMEGFDGERGKIMISTVKPVYTGETCEYNERRSKFFGKIYSRYLAEKRDGKSPGFAEFVRNLVKEYEKEDKLEDKSNN